MSDFLAVAAAADIDILAALGEPATYRQGGAGAPVSLRVVVDRATAEAQTFGTKLRMAGRVVSFRAADVATPAPGDTLATATETLTLRGAPRLDESGLMWTAEA